MNIANLVNTDYADALKEALVMRRNGTIDPATDDQLGVFAYNIATWAIADRIRLGQIPETYRNDPDFRGDVLAMFLGKIDTVDLNREPKEIIKYLYSCAYTSAKDLRKRDTRGKRKHEDVDLDCATLVADFYGNPMQDAVGFVVELNKGESR